MIIANSALRASLAIYHLISNATLVPEVFFSLGATELSGEAAMASREAGEPISTTYSDRSLPLASEKTSGIQGNPTRAHGIIVNYMEYFPLAGQQLGDQAQYNRRREGLPEFLS